MNPNGGRTTILVRRSGRTGRKKRMRCARVSDVPGTNPSPSLGEPRVEGPTVRRRDGPRPGRVSRRWSTRRYRVVRDLLEPSRPPASGRGKSDSRGDRVHRGEPLLLGVGVEYQISCRHSASATSVFLNLLAEGRGRRRPHSLQPAAPATHRVHKSTAAPSLAGASHRAKGGRGHPRSAVAIRATAPFSENRLSRRSAVESRRQRPRIRAGPTYSGQFASSPGRRDSKTIGRDGTGHGQRRASPSQAWR